MWKGKYTSAVEEFAFLLRVDGSILRYTELLKITGPRKTKLKKVGLKWKLASLKAGGKGAGSQDIRKN